jgi:hypothetical protein
MVDLREACTVAEAALACRSASFKPHQNGNRRRHRAGPFNKVCYAVTFDSRQAAGTDLLICGSAAGSTTRGMCGSNALDALRCSPP